LGFPKVPIGIFWNLAFLKTNFLWLWEPGVWLFHFGSFLGNFTVGYLVKIPKVGLKIPGQNPNFPKGRFFLLGGIGSRAFLIPGWPELKSYLPFPKTIKKGLGLGFLHLWLATSSVFI